jgi:aromatic ring-opening dioxygenase catalytic subunit (LigB family)
MALTAAGAAANTAGAGANAAAAANASTSALLPTLFISHGGGPCFHMVARDRSDFVAEIDTHSRAADFFRGLVASLALPAPPRALLVISAHWEEPRATLMTAAQPPMLFDYGGFPEAMYKLSWPAPGAPALAARVRALLGAAGIASGEDAARGFDHGVFVPLMLSFPRADVPCLQLSLLRSLDAAQHLALGAALAPLRAEGVLVVGSGFLTHNMRGGFAAPFSPPFAWAVAFEQMVDDALLLPAEGEGAGAGGAERPASGASAGRAARVAALEKADASLFRQAHPREEHFLPLVVAAAAGLAAQPSSAAAVGAGGEASAAPVAVAAAAAASAAAPRAPVTKIYEQIANGGGSLACYRFDGV